MQLISIGDPLSLSQWSKRCNGIDDEKSDANQKMGWIQHLAFFHASRDKRNSERDEGMKRVYNCTS